MTTVIKKIRPKKVMDLCLILKLLFSKKKMLKPNKALIVLDLSPVIVTQVRNNRDKNKHIKKILLFGFLMLNKKPRIKKKNPFKYAATIGSSLKKLTILSA